MMFILSLVYCRQLSTLTNTWNLLPMVKVGLFAAEEQFVYRMNSEISVCVSNNYVSDRYCCAVAERYSR